MVERAKCGANGAQVEAGGIGGLGGGGEGGERRGEVKGLSGWEEWGWRGQLCGGGRRPKS